MKPALPQFTAGAGYLIPGTFVPELYTGVQFKQEKPFVCFSGHLHRRKVSIPFFRDLTSRPKGVGTALPPVLMVGMNKHS